MNKNLDITERRKVNRQRLLGRGIVLSSHGKVLSLDSFDISPDGLSFTYAGWEEWREPLLQMDFIDHPLFLEKVPVRVISDVMHDDQTEVEEAGLPIRRCGVQFLKLTRAQRGQLERHLKSLT
jgi:hypothetical protein